MREKMAEMQHQIQEFFGTLNQELANRPRPKAGSAEKNSLIPVVDLSVYEE
jgi:hypothetical protein